MGGTVTDATAKVFGIQIDGGSGCLVVRGRQEDPTGAALTLLTLCLDTGSLELGDRPQQC